MVMESNIFESEYKKLNTEQRLAVDTLDGPVMVVAGPGTGKTQVLSLRIANILKKTDTGATGILCLTFTNSGVRAMRQRLLRIIGADAAKVRIATFHSFALDLIEKYHDAIDLDAVPELLDDAGAVSIADHLLETHDWEYIRPRANSAQYFYDIKSVVSTLKRERILPDEFLVIVDNEIESLRIDPESISTRGETKGEIKKDIQKRIESLQRTREVVRFYELYESYKQDHRFVDYDDILKLLVELVSISEEAVHELRENFLYVLVDEHQDSSGVQNEFLEKVWKDTEKPNIFVVGDDRQLIYGFGGAKLDYFENFKTLFGKATLITLVENYRSSQPILDAADSLLRSSLVGDVLRSNHSSKNPVVLYEAPYPRDEILLAGIEIKKKIADGINPNECAVLVPKNSDVRSAVTILSDLGLPVAALDNTDLFLSNDARIMMNLLSITANPYDGTAIGQFLFSPYAEISPLQVHTFLRDVGTRNLSVGSLSAYKKTTTGLFESKDPVSNLARLLSGLVEYGTLHSVYETIQYIGEHVLLKHAEDHDELTERAEVVRTMLHLVIALSQRKGNKIVTISEFLEYLHRLEDYGQRIPLARFGKDHGVKVMTLHASKGLEFEFVWVAHMDEKSLFGGKHSSFVLPERIAALVEEKDDLTVKRQVYVAMTRAKKFCTLSYAKESYTGSSLELAHVFSEINESLLHRRDISESEKILLEAGGSTLVIKQTNDLEHVSVADLTKLVAEEYDKTKVSVTLLNNFFECSWKWYFRNLLQLPEPQSPSLLFGSLVHSCVEDLLASPTVVTEDNIKEIILANVEKLGVVDENEARRMNKEAFLILKKWVINRLHRISKFRESERSISYKDKNLPHLTIYGKVDLIERDTDKSIRVTDFKTGSSRTKSMIEKYDDEGRMSSYLRQLAMYSYLIQSSEKKEVQESVLEFLESKPGDKNAYYSRTITEEEIDLLHRDIRDYDQFVKDGSWVNRPCNAVLYGKNTECEYCALARRIYSEPLSKNPK